jgi:hypothetical protein
MQGSISRKGGFTPQETPVIVLIAKERRLYLGVRIMQFEWSNMPSDTTIYMYTKNSIFPWEHTLAPLIIFNSIIS